MRLTHHLDTRLPRGLGGQRLSRAAVAKSFGQAATAHPGSRELGFRRLTRTVRTARSHSHSHSHSHAWGSRRGVTAVEFAMTAPILFLMLYAALELGHANMTFNTVEAACYEGARVGIVPGAKAADCQAAAERILKISKIYGASVSVVPASLSTPSQSVQVRISLPYADTAIMPATFTRLLTIDRRCELVREKL